MLSEGGKGGHKRFRGGALHGSLSRKIKSYKRTFKRLRNEGGDKKGENQSRSWDHPVEGHLGTFRR